MGSGVDALIGPKVWRGLRASPHAVLTTGFAELDEALGGGWPAGALVEVLVERYGCGELGVLMPALTSLGLTDDDPGWVTWVSPPFAPYPPALMRRGLAAERLLIVEPPAGPAAVRTRHVLWTVEQVLRSGASSAVLAWLPAATNETALRRLQLAAEQRRVITVLFRPLPAQRQRSPAAVRLKVCAEQGATRIEVLKRRGGRPSSLRLDLSAAAHVV